MELELERYIHNELYKYFSSNKDRCIYIRINSHERLFKIIYENDKFYFESLKNKTKLEIEKIYVARDNCYYYVVAYLTDLEELVYLSEVILTNEKLNIPGELVEFEYVEYEDNGVKRFAQVEVETHKSGEETITIPTEIHNFINIFRYHANDKLKTEIINKEAMYNGNTLITLKDPLFNKTEYVLKTGRYFKVYGSMLELMRAIERDFYKKEYDHFDCNFIISNLLEIEDAVFAVLDKNDKFIQFCDITKSNDKFIIELSCTGEKKFIKDAKYDRCHVNITTEDDSVYRVTYFSEYESFDVSKLDID